MPRYHQAKSRRRQRPRLARDPGCAFPSFARCPL